MARRFLPLLLIVLSGVVAVAQQPPASQAAPQAPPGVGQQPPVTFKVEVNYVEVDAVVVDEQGNFVRDLKQEDFRITEDGQQQELAAFSLVDIPVERPEQPLFAAAPIDPDVRSNEREFDGRVYLIVLDDLHTAVERSPQVRRIVRRFIESKLGANDLAAVIHSSGRSDASQDFTNSRTLLLRAVDKFMGRKLRSPTLERLEEYRRRTNFRDGRPERVDDPLEMQRGFQARQMLQTLRNSAEFMTGIRGRRKAMLFISEGIDYDIHTPFIETGSSFRSSDATTILNETREAVASATRANVSIFSVDPRGLTSSGAENIEILAPADDPNLALGPNTLLTDLRVAQDSLRSLAEETGGLAFVSSNDFTQVFDRIVEANSSYYVMGYYPSNDRRDGRFRKIEVRVNRPGLQVRSRRGYVAPRGKQEAAARVNPGGGLSPELREALNNPLPVSGLTMSSTAAVFKGEAPNASVSVTVQVDGKDLKFTEREGQYHDRLEVSIVAVDQQAKIRGGDQHNIDLTLKPDTYQRVAEGGFRLLSRIALPPGRFQLRIAGRETGASNIGSVYYELDVPDFSKEPLAMSGVVIASGAQVQRTLTARPDPQLANLLPGPPTTDREFPRDEELALFVDVYDNVVSPAHKVDILTTVRADAGTVVFENTEERDSSELQGARGGYGHTTRVPLANLTPGLYVLRVQAASRLDSSKTVFREVPFRIR